MQPEGNLVVYDLNQNGAAIWYTDTITNHDNQFLILQRTDGNLVIYGDTGVQYASHRGNYPSHSIMQPDGTYLISFHVNLRYIYIRFWDALVL